MTAASDPVHAAWEAFDAAAIELQQMYAQSPECPSFGYASRDRMAKAGEVSRLWSSWQSLFLASPSRNLSERSGAA